MAYSSTLVDKILKYSRRTKMLAGSLKENCLKCVDHSDGMYHSINQIPNSGMESAGELGLKYNSP